MDADKDGIPDVVTAVIGDGDSDRDSLPDDWEVACSRTDPDNADTGGNSIGDGNADLDGDGLDNLHEFTLKTDPLQEDSDGDSLSDGAETVQTHTNPLSADTDGDGVDDGRENRWGTDPLTRQVRFQVTVPASTVDGQTDTSMSVSVDVPAAQAATLSVQPTERTALLPADMPGLVGGAYDISMEGDPGEATLRFSFNPNLLDDDTFNPVIYWWDEDNWRLEPLTTTVEGSEAVASTTHFSTYLLLNRTVYEESFTWEDEWADAQCTGVQLALVIDDSGSMRSNDPSNQRLQVARSLVDGLPEGSQVSVLRFASGTATLSDMTGDLGAASAALDAGNFRSSGGTRMYSAVSQALGMFQGDDEGILRMMVVLSDGETEDTSLHNQVVTQANGRKVKINTVGLGGGGPGSYYQAWLEPLASQTGGEARLASNAPELVSIYESIGRKVDMETDSDGDGISDWYERHLVLFNGMRLTLDPADPDTDGDGIKDGDEIGGLDYSYNENRTKVKVTGRLNTNPALLDSDGDGIEDGDEKWYLANPLKYDSDNDGLSDGFEVIWGYDPSGENPDYDHTDDAEEFAKGTNPHDYDKDNKETVASFIVGVLAGDFINDDDPVVCLGQIVGGFIPLIDVRDLIANLHHGDYGLAALSALGLVPSVGDVASGAAKAVRYTAKVLGHKPANAAKLLGFLKKYYPDILKKIGDHVDEANLPRKLSNVGYGQMDRKTKRKFIEAIEQAGLGKYITRTSDANGFEKRALSSKWVKSATEDPSKKYNPRKRGEAFDEEINVQSRAVECAEQRTQITVKGHTFRPLGRTFPVADRLEGRVLVSTKTLDLDMESYRTPTRIKSVLDKDFRALDGIETSKWMKLQDGKKGIRWSLGNSGQGPGKAQSVLYPEDYDEKILEVVIPDTAISDEVLEFLTNYKGTSRSGPKQVHVRFVVGGI